MTETITKLLYHIKPPCPKCPYALGQVQFINNPCPACKLNAYQMYHILVEGKYKPKQKVTFAKKEYTIHNKDD